MSVYQDKVVVVTGASQGIGKALCLALAVQKPRLVLAARDQRGARAGRGGMRCKGCRRPPSCRWTSPSKLRAATSSRRPWPASAALDVLLNNAGIGQIARFDETTDLSVYERIMKVNYLGCVYPTYYALPHLKKSRGQIVTVASLAGLTGVPTRTAYSASKHALFGFFDSLRIELRGSGVAVTMIAPYYVQSEIHRRAIGNDGRELGHSTMQEDKLMTAAECAAAIVPAMAKRQRQLTMTLKGKLGRFVKLVAPGVIDNIAAATVRKGR